MATAASLFDVTRYDLLVTAKGPNLADIGYLFDLSTSNSAPYTFTTRARADGPKLTFTELHGQIGQSDVTGWIQSDHGSARHKVRAEVWSRRWTRADVAASLAPLPPRALARSVSGALTSPRPSRWIFSDEPFLLDRIRAIDAKARLHVGTLIGYPVPLTAFGGQVALDHGRLDLSYVRAKLLGGKLSGWARLDARSTVPILILAGSLRSAQLAELRMQKLKQIAGSVDLSLDVRGSGSSLHGAASTASGQVSIRVRQGAIPAPAAFVLGGDLVQAAGTLGTGKNTVGLTCADVDFVATSGKLTVRDFALQTSEGATAGAGWIDLATERIALTLTGQPLHHRMLRVSMPVLIQGSLARPSVAVLPGRNARKLGLKGKLGVLLTPVAGLVPLGRERLPQVVCR